MTKKRCTDCKYTRGIGYDFWCGEGHKKYEVFGAETNCPYYEYHDWSKGTPTTKKQFEPFSQNITKDGSLIIIQKELEQYNIQESVDLLNELNEQLELFKKIFKNMTQQLDIEINSDDTVYKGTFVFTQEEFEILRKLWKGELK